MGLGAKTSTLKVFCLLYADYAVPMSNSMSRMNKVCNAGNYINENLNAVGAN